MDLTEWECEVVRMAQTGEGIALLEGRAVFIGGVFPGERVRVRKTALQRAELLEVLKPSPFRRPPPCPHCAHCGGCDWMALEEAQQRELKQRWVVSTLAREAGIPEGSYVVYPMVFDSRVLGYRRRARLGRAGRRLGFRMRLSAACTPIEFCPVLVPPLQAIPGAFCDAWGDREMGDIEEVALLEGQGETALGVRVHSRVQERHVKKAKRVKERLGLSGVWLQGGERGSTEEEGSVHLRDWGFAYMHPGVFAQANGPMNVQLLRTLTTWLKTLVKNVSDATVLELFSGNGNFTWAMARLVRELWAIESDNLAVSLAQKMQFEKARTLHALTGASSDAPHSNDTSGLKSSGCLPRFLIGDVARVVKGLIQEGKRFDCIVVDPPRQGAPHLGRYAKQLGARYVFYVSCNPSSLARDAAELKREGFSALGLQLFDFFPQTHHVECFMAFCLS